MALTIDVFKKEFEEAIADLKLTWEVVGFHSPDGKVYPFGTDTKVISTVFEALSAPIISTIAEKHGYRVESSLQTVYPDFTLNPADNSPKRIALDIKTTYRKTNSYGSVEKFRYTLGSYTSFLRSPGAAKNIAHPYAEYTDHWTMGFLYTRRAGVTSKVYQKIAGENVELPCPYENVEYFIQEKYKIVGLTPASGNTANIGSFPTSRIQDLRDGLGPFARHGKEVCDNYWRYYGKTAADRNYQTVEEFLAWQKTQT